MNSERRSFFLHLDFGLLIPVFVLILLSLVTLLTVDAALFRSQLFFFLLSFVFYIFFSQINLRAMQLYSLPIYIASVTLLALIFIVGAESRGAIRWLDIFGVRIQFSEVLKPFLALSLSTFLVNRKVSLDTLLQVAVFSLPILFLIYAQPDLGNMLIYLFVITLTLIIAGFPFIWFGLGLLVTSFITPFIWNMLHEYQRERVLTFLQPTKDPLGTSYNAIQSIIAVGSGMFFGKGLSEGTQSSLQFLPERHTDFIFATLSEGLGFVGATIVLVAFSFLLYRIFTIFVNADDTFSKIFCICTFSFFLVQFFVNIGMNVGLLPVVGVTLPFMSYGGSSLLSSFIFLGLLSSIEKNRGYKDILEIS